MEPTDQPAGALGTVGDTSHLFPLGNEAVDQSDRAGKGVVLFVKGSVEVNKNGLKICKIE
jgi:hypothetical protein